MNSSTSKCVDSLKFCSFISILFVYIWKGGHKHLFIQSQLSSAYTNQNQKKKITILFIVLTNIVLLSSSHKPRNATIKISIPISKTGPRTSTINWKHNRWSASAVIKLYGVLLQLNFFIILSFYESARCLKLHIRFLQHECISIFGLYRKFSNRTNWFFSFAQSEYRISMPFHMWAVKIRLLWVGWFGFDLTFSIIRVDLIYEIHKILIWIDFRFTSN